jgi:hypothetical protein
MKVALAAICTLMLMSGCHTTKENVKVQADTVYVAKHTRDSIYVKDSVSRSEKTVLDTVYITESRWSIEYRDRVVRDTIYEQHTDSVRIETKVYPTFMEKAKSAAAWTAVGMLLMFGVITLKKIML